MKMSDVFELPVRISCYQADTITVICLKDMAGYADDHSQVEAAAHAINVHDELVDAVDVLLNHPELADRDAIAELLTRAKGGCDEQA